MTASLLLLLLLVSSSVQAASFFVAPTGCSDSGPGSSGTPWCTIQKAANTVSAGDTVNVASGTYRERVTFNISGTASNLITFTCAVNRTCVVDGGTQVTSGWTAASGFAAGTFEINNSAYGMTTKVPAHATLNDQEFVFVNIGQTPNIDYLNLGVGAQDWNGIEASCRNFGSITRCHFQDNGNPNTKALKLAPHDTGAFHISGTGMGYLWFDGFYFKNAYSCMIIENGAHHITLKNSTCTNGYYAVWIRNGAHNNLLDNNRWFLNWIYENHGLPRYQGPAPGTLEPIQDNLFHAMRSNMPIMSSVYITDAGDNNKVTNNIFDHTGAAGVYQWSEDYHGDPSWTNSNTEIGWNTFNNCQDYCIQVQDTDAGGMQIHHNSFTTYYNGNRFGRILNGAGTAYYVYKNTYSNPTGCPACGRGADHEFSAVTSVAAGVLPNGMKAYFYHNSSNNGDFSISAYDTKQDLTNVFFVNTIHSGARLWVMEWTSNDGGAPPTYYGRTYSGGTGAPASPPSWTSSPQIWVVPTRIWTNNETVFALPAGHAAIDAGVDLSASWTAGSDGTQPALPGMSPGYFFGTAPDLGAVESDEVVEPPVTGNPRIQGKVGISGNVTVK